MPTIIFANLLAAAHRLSPRKGRLPAVILTCPACRTRYLVDEQDVDRPTGRAVRCAGCGYSWRYPPIPDPRKIEPPPRVEPALEVPPRPEPLPMPTRPRAPRRRAAIGWFVLGVVIVLAALFILVALFARSEVTATWPAAGRLYAWAGLAPRLELGKVVPTRSANSLVIEGEVTNSGNMASDVPQLRVALRDSTEKEVQFKIIDPPKARLGPSETARFKTTFDHPDEAATGVVVTFAR
jgi:predicted Zn finger-like uncharacterized protein